jgi:hypothetical protein
MLRPSAPKSRWSETNVKVLFGGRLVRQTERVGQCRVVHLGQCVQRPARSRRDTLRVRHRRHQSTLPSGQALIHIAPSAPLGIHRRLKGIPQQRRRQHAAALKCLEVQTTPASGGFSRRRNSHRSPDTQDRGEPRVGRAESLHESLRNLLSRISAGESLEKKSNPRWRKRP